MSSKEEAKKRTQMLKQLREEHKETVGKTQALLKEQNTFRKQVTNAMKEGLKTIPEIADTAGLPPNKVLWHVTAMKKYNIVNEVGMSGEYYQYELAEEVKK